MALRRDLTDLPRPTREIPPCHFCVDGKHHDCVDNYPVHDITDLLPQMCGCTEGDCAPTMSWACAEWLHNCPGCICACHDDEAARALWQQAHDRYLAKVAEEAAMANGTYWTEDS